MPVLQRPLLRIGAKMDIEPEMIVYAAVRCRATLSHDIALRQSEQFRVRYRTVSVNDIEQ
jgi:hypothetical protein